MSDECDLTNILKCGINAQLLVGGGSEEPDENKMNMLALDTVLIALVIILLVELLGLGERLAVGRVPA